MALRQTVCVDLLPVLFILDTILPWAPGENDRSMVGYHYTHGQCFDYTAALYNRSLRSGRVLVVLFHNILAAGHLVLQTSLVTSITINKRCYCSEVNNLGKCENPTAKTLAAVQKPVFC